jgi:hypothetical protein
MGTDQTAPKLELEDIQSIILKRRPSPTVDATFC